MAKMPKYTQEEDDWLRENYPCSNREILLKRFPNRTPRGVLIHVYELGLKKDKDAIDLPPEVDTVIGHLSEIEKAYLAGIIDGEGCITLQRTVRKNMAGYSYYHIRLQISNTSPRLKMWLEKHMPDAGRFTLITNCYPKRRDYWHWTTKRNRQCMIFLSEISPYLVIKKEQAELLSQGYVTLNDDQRDALYKHLCSLKHTS